MDLGLFCSLLCLPSGKALCTQSALKKEMLSEQTDLARGFMVPLPGWLYVLSQTLPIEARSRTPCIPG